MSIWLWVVVFLTWCAFLWILSSLKQFRELLMKNDMLDRELRHAKKALRQTENARMEAENYIEEKHKELSEWSEVYDEQSEVLNEWSEAYAEQGEYLNRSLDLFDEWTEWKDAPRKKYDSFAEIDDLLVQSTAKEFIRLMGWKRALDEKAKQPVVNLNVQKDIRNAVEEIHDSFKKIKFNFSEKGLGDIQSLIEVEKEKFLNKKERNTSLS